MTQIIFASILTTDEMLWPLPGTNGQIRDGIEVGFQHLRVLEHFVSKRVEPSQHYHDLGGCHPILKDMIRENDKPGDIQGGEFNISLS